MKLTAESVLGGVGDALRDQFLPHIADEFAASSARMAQSLIAIVALGMDDAVAIRVEEHARIRELLGTGAGLVEPGELAARLGEAAASRDPGLTISALDRESTRLRALLVTLHAWTEEQDSPAARALDQAIWRALRDFEMARRPRA